MPFCVEPCCSPMCPITGWTTRLVLPEQTAARLEEYSTECGKAPRRGVPSWSDYRRVHALVHASSMHPPVCAHTEMRACLIPSAGRGACVSRVRLRVRETDRKEEGGHRRPCAAALAWVSVQSMTNERATRTTLTRQLTRLRPERDLIAAPLGHTCAAAVARLRDVMRHARRVDTTCSMHMHFETRYGARVKALELAGDWGTATGVLWL